MAIYKRRQWSTDSSAIEASKKLFAERVAVIEKGRGFETPHLASFEGDH